MDFSSNLKALVSLSKRENVSMTTRNLCLDLVEPLKQQINEKVSPDAILQLLSSEHWEANAVGLVLSKNLLKAEGENQPKRNGLEILGQSLHQKILQMAHDYLEHPEPRLRCLIAEVLGALSCVDGISIFKEFQEQIMESIACNLQRSHDYDYTNDDVKEEEPNQSINSPPVSPRSAHHALDDTTGWKALETSMSALNHMMRGSTDAFRPYVTKEFIELAIVETTEHINRHVRAVAFDILTTLCSDVFEQEFALIDFGKLFVDCLSIGLQDNWSQVRFAASVANRAFLLKLEPETRKQFFPLLVPRMCLNRYYLAEGVKLYSQESWRLIMGDSGREVVASLASEVASYYIKVCDMDNHCVREAGCHCIAELACKIPAKQVLAPFVLPLLDALLSCFQDASWPVRDAACIASGKFVIGFPEESRPRLDTLYVLWFDHLSDNIWSVREDAAIAIANVIRAYGKEAKDKVLPLLDSCLLKAKNEQPAQTEAEYRAILADEKTHTGNQVYSCGSLAPKLSKNKKKGGCSDCQVHRAKEPWEYTDGAIYLVRELCSFDDELQIAAGYFEKLVDDVAMLRHFPQAIQLQETLWKELPKMANILGKKKFKRYLELFLDPLLFTLQSSNRLASHAAKECLKSLHDQIGNMIFMGRLEANPHWLQEIGPIVNRR